MEEKIEFEFENNLHQQLGDIHINMTKLPDEPFGPKILLAGTPESGYSIQYSGNELEVEQLLELAGICLKQIVERLKKGEMPGHSLNKKL